MKQSLSSFLKFKRTFLASAFICMGLSLSSQAQESSFPEFTVQTITENLSKPWAFEFIDQNTILVTQKSGELLVIENGQLKYQVKGLPPVLDKNQGGLMDVALHPDFANNGWVYLSYAHQEGQLNGLRILRGKLKDQSLVEQQVLFTASPLKKTPVHYGARMSFLADNSLVFSVGDGFDYREDAQRLNKQLGKMIRIKDDGSLPTDNPFIGQDNKDPYIWSYGHRNSQGLSFDAQRNILFANEHGPAGGDEINMIEAGKNYGWPVITYGKDYSGATITPFQTFEGMEQPFVNWTPSIAPSSLAVYNGDMFPSLNGDLLTTSLKFNELRWVKLDGINTQNLKVVKQESLLKDLDLRLRDVKVGPKGAIYVLSDGDNGKLIKLMAK